jgi:superfamily I DNA and/or RNA helicase
MALKKHPKSLENGSKISQMTTQVSILVYIYYISCYILLIFIAPSIPDDFTADLKLNKLLFCSEKAIELFKDCQIDDLLRPLPYFKLISIHTYSGRPQNLDNEKHWHLLRLFKLFFNWETMSIIVKEINSYAFRTNSAQNP